MSAKTPQSISEAIDKIFRLRYSTKFALKKSYDNWAIKQMWSDKKRSWTILAQKLDLEAHQEFGADLAVSRFVVGNCGGKIRDREGTWITKKRDLPKEYRKSFIVTAINASGVGLLTEGIDNFVGLDYVKSLDLSENPKLDDFACDQLARQFRNSKTLCEIDLSHNPRITMYGLDVLFRIPSLKKIVAIKTRATEHEEIDLFSLSAEDERGCQVFVHEDGRQFRLPELEDLRSNNPRITC